MVEVKVGLVDLSTPFIDVWHQRPIFWVYFGTDFEFVSIVHSKLNLLKTKHETLLFLAFWLIVFMVNLGPSWERYASFREGLEVAGLATVLQVVVALLALKWLVPRFLDRNRLLGFALWMLVLVFLASEIYVLVSYLYLEPAYPNTYGAYYQAHLYDLSLWERLGFSWTIKFIVMDKWPVMFFPAAILIAANFYQKQKHVLELKEQKQAAELHALKSQLNPHFIFNTLNNIYALALSRSERTAEAVERLSGILDYVLHHAPDGLVLVADEVQMIQDYIALEKLRFGDRVNVTFEHDTQNSVKVAPLLFLSLVENAFKHGASQALDQARINIVLHSQGREIVFDISNSKPPSQSREGDGPGIGLKNLKRQLELLYPNAHQLTSEDSKEAYHAMLTIQTKIDHA